MKPKAKDRALHKNNWLPKELSISQDLFQSLKNTTTNQKVNIAQTRKEKVLHKQDQEPKFATTYAQKLTSHAHVHQELLHAVIESENDFYRILTLNKSVKILINFRLKFCIIIIFYVILILSVFKIYFERNFLILKFIKKFLIWFIKIYNIFEELHFVYQI